MFSYGVLAVILIAANCQVHQSQGQGISQFTIHHGQPHGHNLQDNPHLTPQRLNEHQPLPNVYFHNPTSDVSLHYDNSGIFSYLHNPVPSVSLHQANERVLTHTYSDAKTPQRSTPIISSQHAAAAPTIVQKTTDPIQSEDNYNYQAYPKYEFEYKVEDLNTGDIKSQRESRDGDFVEGEYSLHEPDGSVRTVKYNSDKHTGFNANVKHSDYTKHRVPKLQNH